MSSCSIRLDAPGRNGLVAALFAAWLGFMILVVPCGGLTFFDGDLRLGTKRQKQKNGFKFKFK